jgi:outer membrane cobalamin receptor
VYVDQVRLGGVAELQNIPANQVERVRLYRAGEATTKYGLGNMGGVIEVTSRR